MDENECWQQYWTILARMAEYNGKPEEARELIEDLENQS